jgi:hypothetical protein
MVSFSTCLRAYLPQRISFSLSCMCRFDLAFLRLFTGPRQRTSGKKIRPAKTRLERFRFKGFRLKATRRASSSTPSTKTCRWEPGEKNHRAGP